MSMLIQTIFIVARHLQPSIIFIGNQRKSDFLFKKKINFIQRQICFKIKCCKNQKFYFKFADFWLNKKFSNFAELKDLN